MRPSHAAAGGTPSTLQVELRHSATRPSSRAASERRRKWWGWGFEDDGVDEAGFQRLLEALRGILGVTDLVSESRPRSSDAILAHGGTITHHHAVGRTHRPWFEAERGPVWLATLESAKRVLDPEWILNPGVLLPVPRALRR
jgi:hypothetical protein